VRFRDLMIAQEHQREVDPVASGALAGISQRLVRTPLLNHEIKQFVGRVNPLPRSCRLEFPPLMTPRS
jgi:hypothetical protein